MDVAVLHIGECPNWEVAGQRVSEALAATGRPDVQVQYVLIEDTDTAARYGFAGSPTIMVAGSDLFPGGAASLDLACRVYFTPTGLAGLPSAEQIREALITRVGNA